MAQLKIEFEEEKSKDKLKKFMQDNFDFSTLKKIGFYPKEMKFNDYEGQAKRICWYFGYDSVYEYLREEIRCHISYADPKPDPLTIPRHREFVEVIGGSVGKLKVIDKSEAKIVQFKSEP